MPLNFPVARAASKSDAELVWHFNDTVVPRPVDRLCAALAERWADEIAISSGVVSDYFFTDGTDTTTLYPPVDTEEFSPERVSIDRGGLRAELGIPSGVPIVGTIGNINPVKGYEDFLRAIGRVRSKGTPVAAPIVGSELDSQRSYSKRLRRVRSEWGLEDTVVFTGWRSDIPELLSLFDLFVLPSMSESGPMVVLEAMAMECPVVTTDVGLISEQFEDDTHCWIVSPGNTDALTASIVEALTSQEERRIRAANARKKVLQDLSLSSAVDAHEALYKRTVEANAAITSSTVDV